MSGPIAWAGGNYAIFMPITRNFSPKISRIWKGARLKITDISLHYVCPNHAIGLKIRLSAWFSIKNGRRKKIKWNANFWKFSELLLKPTDSSLQTIRHQDNIQMSASASKFRNLKYYLWNMRYHPKTAPLKRLRPVVLG